MSDIAITFPWYAYPLLIAMIGWPGLLVGAGAGGLIWRRRRPWGVLIGALVGCLAWAGIMVLWR